MITLKRKSLIFLIALSFLFVFCGAASAATTEMVSINSQQEPANGGSAYPSISSDGYYITYVSDANNLVSSDTNGVSDIFMFDTQTGTTTRVSVASDGTQANLGSVYSSMSADGRYVTFDSYASNLVHDDTNGVSDIFVHDMITGSTTRVSVASDGTQANGESSRSCISSDGRYIAFYSSANNLVLGDTNNNWDVFLRDMLTGITTRVSVASDGTQGNAGSYNPSISGDGRYISFDSSASNLVSGDTNGALDVFVHDMITGSTTRVSVASDGTQANSLSSTARNSISSDGRYITFDSWANNLVADDTNSNWDVFVYDMITGSTTRVSVASDGTQANSYSGIPFISGDGRYITFDSWATNLVSGENNGLLHVFVRDMVTGTTTRVSVDKDGTQANGDCYAWGVSGNGHRIVFYSTASNLVAMDNNQVSDIFLRDLNAWNIYPGDSIQDAIDSLAPGGEVNIHAGTYTENIMINIPKVTLKSAGDGTVTIQAADNSKPVISIFNGGSGSIIQGLTITGGFAGIKLNYADKVTISGNTVTNSLDSGIIFYEDSDDNIVTGNTITGNKGIGIDMRSSDRNTVSGNTVINNYFGIFDWVYGSANKITDNTIIDNIWDGIRLWSHITSDTVTGNTIIGNGNGIQITSSTDNTISGNTIRNNEYSGIKISFGSDANTISNNTITGNVYNGISVSDSSGNTIQNNMITNNGYHDGTENIERNGIYLKNSGTQARPNIITGNIITGNRQYGILFDNSSYNQIINGNNITGNGYNGISIINSSGNLVNNNVISDNGNEINEYTHKNGIYLLNSGLGTEISENTINNNKYDGILLQGSSVAEIHFNRIVFNQNYGLENQGTGIVNAQNNWWGSNNNPIDKSQPQIINSETGKVNADTWLILSLSPKKQTISTIETAIVTADLTINNLGENTLSTYSKHVPDGTFVYFTTNMGQISLISSTTSEGKATTNFSSPNTGTATIVVTLDKQSIDTTVKIKKK